MVAHTRFRTVLSKNDWERMIYSQSKESRRSLHNSVEDQEDATDVIEWLDWSAKVVVAQVWFWRQEEIAPLIPKDIEHMTIFLSDDINANVN